MQIRYSKQAAKAVRKIPQDMAAIIKKAIEGLAETPPKGDINNAGLFRREKKAESRKISDNLQLSDGQ